MASVQDRRRMYLNLLERIREKSKSYGESLQPPCSSESLDALRARTRYELSVDLPEEFADFLRLANGLDWNGLAIYASERSMIVGHSGRFIEGFVEGNLVYRELEAMRRFLVFGGDGDCLYVLHLPDGNFEVITTVGLTVLETFVSFGELLVNALEAHA